MSPERAKLTAELEDLAKRKETVAHHAIVQVEAAMASVQSQLDALPPEPEEPKEEAHE